MRARAKKLAGILKNLEGKILIIGHQYSDPDSIASKYGWAYIIKERFGLGADVAYANASSEQYISQSLNKKIEEYYNKPEKEASKINLNDYSGIIMVDTNPSLNNNPFTEEQLNLIDGKKLIIIDHHGKSKEKKGFKNKNLYEDIDEQVSSTSIQTMEYLKDFNLDLKKSKKEGILLSVSLWLGADIDLKSQNKPPSSRYLSALSFIIDAIGEKGKELREEIENVEIPIAALNAIRMGLNNINFTGPYAISYAGEIIPEHKHSVLPMLADDLLLKTQGISACISWALINDEPYASVRSKPEKPQSARKIAAMFGGYGHLNSAGFKADLGFYIDYPEESKDLIVKLVEEKIVSQIESKTGATKEKNDHYSNLERKIVEEQLIGASKINRQQLPDTVNRAKGNALKDYERYGIFVNGYAGDIIPEHIRYLPHIAEELLCGEGINISIVWALVNGHPLGYVKTDEMSQYNENEISSILDKNNNSNIPSFIINIGFFKGYPKKAKENIIQLTKNIISYKIKNKIGKSSK
ncbi:MAG: DHH family phosphoesterase [Nanoarchaeota archaeon]|nr:DHH family phosphoesterase [Nanoarchaeota archaeon]